MRSALNMEEGGQRIHNPMPPVLRPALVSIIVPVWNSAAYLPACLESLTAQTLPHIEILAVNDASSDDSLAVLQAWAQRDTRLRVIDLDHNQGASAARNIGMRQAVGEYIAFVDSDDRLKPDFCEKLYRAAVSSGADIAKGDFSYDDRPGGADLEYNNKIRADKNAFYIQFCAAIYRRSFLVENNIFFPADLHLSEDLVFAFSAAVRANHVEIVDDAHIVINTRPGSATCVIPQRKHIIQHYRALEKIVELARNSVIGVDAFNYVTASVFALFLRIAVKSTEPDIRKFVAAKNVQLFKTVKASARFDEELFIRYLGQYNSIMHDCLVEYSPENLDVLSREIKKNWCELLRKRAQ